MSKGESGNESQHLRDARKRVDCPGDGVDILDQVEQLVLFLCRKRLQLVHNQRHGLVVEARDSQCKEHLYQDGKREGGRKGGSRCTHTVAHAVFLASTSSPPALLAIPVITNNQQHQQMMETKGGGFEQNKGRPIQHQLNDSSASVQHPT